MSEGDAELAGKVRRGAAWGALNIAASRIIQFAATIIVARLVAPDEFGALAVAIVIQTIAMNASELGATAAIARGNRDAAEVAPTVYTIALSTSFGLTAVIMLTAPQLAAALGDPSAAAVIQVMSLTVMLSGISSVPSALMWRDYQQKKRAGVDLANAIVSLVLVVPLALIGLGAMALAWSRVGGQVVATVGYIALSQKRFRPGFDSRVFREVLRLGLPLAAANILVFATLNVDYVVIGRELGPGELGLYLVAFNLAAIPSTLVTAVVRTVAIPTFGRMHAQGRLAEAAERAVSLMSLLAFLISALLAGLGGPLVVTIYGENWRGAAAAMVGLSVFGAARILSEVFADLCVGAGRTLGLFWIQAVWLVALIPAMLWGVQVAGIAGAGLANAAVAWLVVVPIYVVLLSRAAAISLARLVVAVLPCLLVALLAGLLAWLVAEQISQPIVAAAAGVLAGSLLYVSLLAKRIRSEISFIRRASGHVAVAARG